QRFASAEAMADALVGTEATVTAPETVLSGIPLAAPTEETAALDTATQVAPGPPLPLEPRPRPRRRPPLVAVLAAAAVALVALLLLVTGRNPAQPVRTESTTTLPAAASPAP